MEMAAQNSVDRPQNPQCHRDKSCTGKRRYPSKHQAKLARKGLHSHLGHPTNLVAYRCVYCEWFHLGGKAGANPMRDLDQAFIEAMA